MTKIFAAFAALATLAACGNPVASGSYKGQPLVTLHGRIGLEDSTTVPVHPSVAVVWVAQQADGGQLSTPLGPQSVPNFVGEIEPVSASSFPASFDFQIFNPPPAQAMGVQVGGPFGTGQVAEGMVIAVDDVDGDGAFTLINQVISYTCAADGGCTLPTGNWLAVGNSNAQLDSSGTVIQGSLVAIEVAAPDVLLGSSPDFFLLYESTAAAAAVTSASTGILNSALLAQPGYHLVNDCQSGPEFAQQVVADSTPVDIHPHATLGLGQPTLSTCATAQVDCSGTTCPLYCNPTAGWGSSVGCACAPRSKNVSYEMGATCNSDADCCTGLCQQVDGGLGVCGPTTPLGLGCTPNDCSPTVANQGAVVPLMQVAAPWPQARGGALPPEGTYVLTAADLFTDLGGATGPTGDTYQDTIVIGPSVGDGGVAFEQVSNDNACGNATTAVLALGAGGFRLTFSGCQTTGDVPFSGYTLNPGAPTTFQINDEGAPGIVLTYTAQQ